MHGLLQRSNRHRIVLYALFLGSVAFGLNLYYWVLISDILKYPEFRTLRHYKIQFEYQPKTLVAFLLIVYLLTSFIICSMYLMLKVSTRILCILSNFNLLVRSTRQFQSPEIWLHLRSFDLFTKSTDPLQQLVQA